MMKSAPERNAMTTSMTYIMPIFILIMGVNFAFLSGADFIIKYELKKVKTAANIGKIKVGSLAPISNHRKVPCFKKSTRDKACYSAHSTGI